MDWIDLSTVQELFSQALSHQITQFTIAFGIASWMHSSRVRKEIRMQMESMVGAVDNVAKVLRADLDRQSKSVEQLTSRVEALEKE